MEMTTEFSIPPGWYNLQAKRRRNAMAHIFLDQGLLRRTPLKTSFVPYRLDNSMWNLNGSKHLCKSGHDDEDGNDYLVLRLWRQAARQGRRNAEWDIFLTQRQSKTTK
ncbi:hypothetical protein ACJMK2_042343 [Sinanodonta woodiana]|uniref:Uncharacterized protein n=1 Tax=Sinanodonta woodiana TaxID=1069815 RepID=A0ABD3W8G1_SINWO